jgi:hypothetical protein
VLFRLSEAYGSSDIHAMIVGAVGVTSGVRDQRQHASILAPERTRTRTILTSAQIAEAAATPTASRARTRAHARDRVWGFHPDRSYGRALVFSLVAAEALLERTPLGRSVVWSPIRT